MATTELVVCFSCIHYVAPLNARLVTLQRAIAKGKFSQMDSAGCRSKYTVLTGGRTDRHVLLP